MRYTIWNVLLARGWKSSSKAALSPHFAAASNVCSRCDRALRAKSDLLPDKVSELMVKTAMGCSLAPGESAAIRVVDTAAQQVSVDAVRGKPQRLPAKASMGPEEHPSKGGTCKIFARHNQSM